MPGFCVNLKFPQRRAMQYRSFAISWVSITSHPLPARKDLRFQHLVPLLFPPQSLHPLLVHRLRQFLISSLLLFRRTPVLDGLNPFLQEQNSSQHNSSIHDATPNVACSIQLWYCHRQKIKATTYRFFSLLLFFHRPLFLLGSCHRFSHDFSLNIARFSGFGSKCGFGFVPLFACQLRTRISVPSCIAMPQV